MKKTLKKLRPTGRRVMTVLLEVRSLAKGLRSKFKTNLSSK